MPGLSGYPREQVTNIVLRDGSTVHVRPVEPADREAMRTFLEGVSHDAVAFRFFSLPSLDWVTTWSLDVDYADRFGLVAERGTPPEILAHAAYIRTGADRAEIAFLVADAWQGRGISTSLLAHLAGVAEQHGITTFTADVLPHNHRMIDVFRESGFPVQIRSVPDAVRVEMPTSLSPEAIERFEERERTAAVAAVRSVLEPRSVAVVGASRRRGTVGGELLHNLLAGGFEGEVHAVNPHGGEIESLTVHRSVGEIPGGAELAVVAVPAEQVVAVARECVPAGVRTLLVISAGFAETGAEGARRQRELLDVCRDAGMRLVGPNCLGVLNTTVGLNATFGPSSVVPGAVGLMSQSGGLGIAIVEAVGQLGLGLSSFVSIGNRADLSGNDFLHYWEQDPATELALLYMESFGNPRKFARIARRMAAVKPVVAVKSGRSAAGARATASHTGAMLAASDVTVDALFEQAGVVRTDTMHELFDVAALLSAQPVPSGGRTAIITNGGGPGILCADACQGYGVAIPEPSAKLKARLAEALPHAASLGNPIDMIATASPDDYRRTLRILMDSSAYDAIVAIFVPALGTDPGEVARAIREAVETDPGTTVASVFMMNGSIPPELRSSRAWVPGYAFPEDAARAVSLAIRHGRWRTRERGSTPELSGLRTFEAAAIISRALADGSDWLSPPAVAQLLDCYRLPLVRTRIVPDAGGAVAAAEELGMPVALKASAAGLLHKTDAGGVRLGLEDADAVRAAVAEIERAVTHAGYQLDGLIVQPMAPDGVELIVGVVNDHSFGPVVACGAGGTIAELVKDVAVRITPLSDVDAREMVRSLRTFPLLDGYRGAPRADVAAVEDVLLRVSAMVEAHPEIAELDCNPLIVTPSGAVIVDGRVRVEAPPPPPPRPSVDA